MSEKPTLQREIDATPISKDPANRYVLFMSLALIIVIMVVLFVIYD